MSGEADEKARELERRAAQWMDMPRGCIEEREAAEEFYRKQIMPLLKDVFIRREHGKVAKEYEGLFLSVGDSYAPLVLSIATLRPKRVCFLVTEQSRRYLDIIVDMTGLRPSAYDVRDVDKDNPLQIYQAIKDVYQKWGRPANVALDFTGGTKAMSGGSAMAGGVIGADLVYIASSRYISDLRCPYPGSEHLEFIPNPYEVFGDLEEAQALELMRKHDYAGARRIFSRLTEVVPEPRRYRVLELLAQAYEEWDNLELDRAAEHLGEVIRLVRQYGQEQRGFVLQSRLGQLERQREALELLRGGLKALRNAARRGGRTAVEVLGREEFVRALMGTLYCNALRREQQNKLDMAALLLYRLLELVEQAALAGYGLDTAAPDYSKVAAVRPDELAAGFAKLRAKVYRESYVPASLPAPISLVDGYIVLAALEDPVTRDLDWNRLRGLVEQRNFGIFAHGFEFVKERNYAEFKGLVRELADRYLERFGTSLDELKDTLGFVTVLTERTGSVAEQGE